MNLHWLKYSKLSENNFLSQKHALIRYSRFLFKNTDARFGRKLVLSIQNIPFHRVTLVKYISILKLQHTE